MPIDFLSRRQQEEETLRKLIEKYPGDDLSRTAADISNIRAGLIPELQRRTPGVDVTRAFTEKIPQLERNVSAQLGGIKRQRDTQRFNLIFNNAYDMAIQAGYDDKQAGIYASKLAEQDRQQAFESVEAEKERESARRLNELANIYSNKGVELEQEFNPQFDYRNALMRALIGTGTALGTGYYLRNRNKSTNIPDITGQYKDTGSLRAGTGFYLPFRRKPLSLGNLDQDPRQFGYTEGGNYGI